MSVQPEESQPARPAPTDLPAFLPYACAQLQAPFTLRVLLQLQDEYVSKAGEERSKKKGARTSRTFDSPTKTEAASVTGDAMYDEEANAIVLVAVQDTSGRVVELVLPHARRAPRLLLKVIGLCLPYQPLLYKLTARWGPLPSVALYEIAQLLPSSQITEVCLDDVSTPLRDYAQLLDAAPRLRRLSLARCALGDAAVRALALRLELPAPAARCLLALNLACDRVSDAGVAALAQALRTNRTLQYLNLSGNSVTDEGAAALFRIMMEFPLTTEEVIAKRERRMNYLKSREELYKKCINELSSAQASRAVDENIRKKKSTAAGPARRKSLTVLRRASASSVEMSQRAHEMVTEQLGPFSDPFAAEETVVRGQHVYCAGNATLCALNLAHNALGHCSVAMLVRVARHQAARTPRPGPGLARVVLDGNPVPADAELRALHDLLAVANTAVTPQRRPDRSAVKVKSK